jgi:hypothetical protein
MAKRKISERIRDAAKKISRKKGKQPTTQKAVRSPKKGPPVCRKCGREHWHYSPCPDRPTVDRKVPWAKEDERMVSRGGKIVPARPQGVRPFQQVKEEDNG